MLRFDPADDDALALDLLAQPEPLVPAAATMAASLLEVVWSGPGPLADALEPLAAAPSFVIFRHLRTADRSERVPPSRASVARGKAPCLRSSRPDIAAGTISCIHMCMRTTLNLRDDLLEKAAALSGLTEKTALVHAGLEALIAREAAKRLARLGGGDERAASGRRRRSATG